MLYSFRSVLDEKTIRELQFYEDSRARKRFQQTNFCYQNDKIRPQGPQIL